MAPRGSARLSGWPRAVSVPALLCVTEQTTVHQTHDPRQHSTYTQQAHRRQLRRLRMRGRAQRRARHRPAAAPASPWSARARPAAASQTPRRPLQAHGRTQRAARLRATCRAASCAAGSRTRRGRRGRGAQHLHGHRADPALLAARPLLLATRLGRPRLMRVRSQRGRSTFPATQQLPQQEPGRPGRTGAPAFAAAQATHLRALARAATTCAGSRSSSSAAPGPAAPPAALSCASAGRSPGAWTPARGARCGQGVWSLRSAGCERRARQALTACGPGCLALALRGAPPPPLLRCAALLCDGAPLPLQLFLGCHVPGGERHLLRGVVIVRRVRAGGRPRRPRAHAGRLHCVDTAF